LSQPKISSASLRLALAHQITGVARGAAVGGLVGGLDILHNNAVYPRLF